MAANFTSGTMISSFSTELLFSVSEVCLRGEMERLERRPLKSYKMRMHERESSWTGATPYLLLPTTCKSGSVASALAPRERFDVLGPT